MHISSSIAIYKNGYLRDELLQLYPNLYELPSDCHVYSNKGNQALKVRLFVFSHSLTPKIRKFQSVITQYVLDIEERNIYCCTC